MNDQKKRGGRKGLTRRLLAAFLSLVMLTAAFTSAAAIVIGPGGRPSSDTDGPLDMLPTPKPSATPTPTPAPTPTPQPGTYQPYGPVNNIVLPGTGTQQGRNLTYYDIYGGSMDNRSDTSDQVAFLMDVVTRQDNLVKWLNLAYNILESNGNMYWDHAKKGWDTDFGNGHYIDFIKYMQQQVSGSNDGSKDDKYISSGVSVATSLADAQKRTGQLISDCIGHKLTGKDFVDHHSMDQFNDGTTGQNVVYTTVAHVDRYGSSYQYGYNGFGLVFYDFQLHVLDDGGAVNSAFGDKKAGDAKTSVIPDVTYTSTGTDEISVMNQTKNEDKTEATSTLTLQQSGSGTSTTTTTSTQNYSIGETFGRSATVGVKVPAVADGTASLSSSVNFGQSFGFTTSDQQARTETTGSSVATTVKVPPHTAGAIKESKSVVTVTTKFDCPVGITYKVALYSMCGTCYDDNAANHTFATAGYDQRTFLTIFSNESGDGVEGLYQRGIVNAGKPGVDQTIAVTATRTRNANNQWAYSLDWNKIFKMGVPVTHDASSGKMKQGQEMVTQLVNRYPMSVTGAELKCEESSYVTEVAPSVPLYPIATIALDKQYKRIFNLQPGDSLPIYSYKVIAKDAGGVAYYGFNKAWGEWKVVDENCKPVDSDVVEVSLDPVIKQQRIVAKAPGTAYVMYFINENTYKDANGRYSTNDDISSAAYKIEVADAPEAPFDGTVQVQVTGDLEVEVNESVNLNSLDNVMAAAYDKTGRMVDVELSWEAQELSKYGITVTADGVLTATKPGTFHVRAFYQDVYSEWVPVTAVKVVKGAEALIISSEAPVPITPEQPEDLEPAEMEFDPGSMLSRGDFVEMLHTICGGHNDEDQSVISGFSDVSEDSAYNACLNWARENGFVSGDGTGNFNPSAGITREQVATVLYNIAKAKGLITSISTQDVQAALANVQDSDKIQAWAREAVAFALQHGYLETDENGMVNCADFVQKSPMANVISRIAENANMLPDSIDYDVPADPSIDETLGEP